MLMRMAPAIVARVSLSRPFVKWARLRRADLGVADLGLAAAAGESRTCAPIRRGGARRTPPFGTRAGGPGRPPGGAGRRSPPAGAARPRARRRPPPATRRAATRSRSEQHTSALQSLMPMSYAVTCLEKHNKQI